MKKDREQTVIIEDEQPIPAVLETIILGKPNTASENIVNEDTPEIPDDEKIPERAVLNDDGSWTLPLLYPRSIKVSKGGVVTEVEYTELRFYRLTGADMRTILAASKETGDRVLMERSCRISSARMRALYEIMDAEDIADAQKICVSFLGNGRRTGR